jgi:hypothetical protein
MASTVAGQTTHYIVSFDNSLPNGQALATGFLAVCESDYSLMQSWFVGVNNTNAPNSVEITGGAPGGCWTGSSVTISVGSNGSVDLVRFIVVAEVVEQFMASQNIGWFQGGDEGSKGEGLSRFLAVQSNIANGLSPNMFPEFNVVSLWLNGGRPDFIDTAPDDHQPDAITGCSTCFIYYLSIQLSFSIQSIIAAGAATLDGVYRNLTGQTGAWTSFSDLVNSAYPLLFPGTSTPATYHPLGDNIFPIPQQITQFFAPNQITVGFSGNTQVVINAAALAEVNIALTSANPAVVSVPSFVSIAIGQTSATVAIQAPPSDGPFPAEVNVTASYAGQELTMTVEVVAPSLQSIDFAPNSIVAGARPVQLTATVSLNQATFAGPVVVDLVSFLPAYASVPQKVTIPQGQIFVSFTVTVPAIQTAFQPIRVPISASAAGNVIYGYFTVASGFNHGVVAHLSVAPTTIAGVGSSQGTVTLQAAVNVATVVGISALTGLVQTNSKGSAIHQVPTPGSPSQPAKPGSTVVKPSNIVFVPSTITIPAGQTTGQFTISTSRLPVGASPQSVVIGAAANGVEDLQQRWLTVTA